MGERRIQLRLPASVTADPRLTSAFGPEQASETARRSPGDTARSGTAAATATRAVTAAAPRGHAALNAGARPATAEAQAAGVETCSCLGAVLGCGSLGAPPLRGKRDAARERTTAELDAPGASQMSGCCKHQSSRHAASGGAAGSGQWEPRWCRPLGAPEQARTQVWHARASRVSQIASHQAQSDRRDRLNLVRLAVRSAAKKSQVPRGSERASPKTG